MLPAVTPGNLPLTYTADPASVCTVAGTTVSLHGVGTCTVTADQAGDAGHLPATATGTFAVTAIVVVTPPTPPIPELSLHVDAGQVVADSAIVVDGDGFKPYSDGSNRAAFHARGARHRDDRRQRIVPHHGAVAARGDPRYPPHRRRRHHDR